MKLLFIFVYGLYFIAGNNISVFTSRYLPFTSNSWPQTGTTASVSTSSADLRFVTSSTIALLSPYLGQNFAVANLKSPYNNQTSQTAINLNEVGTTTLNSFYGIEIGDNSNAGNFNVFDSHKFFIVANNSNVKAVNNVFQNTVRSSPGLFPTANLGGTAVRAAAGTFNSILDLSSSAKNLGNKFWNCHTAVHANNVLRFNFTNALVRSNQSTLTASGIQQGNTGILLSTNRFQYEIKDNEFTNINTCIHIPMATGFYTSVAQGTVNGIYGHKINIETNTLTAGSSNTNYISHGIRISSPNNFPIAYSPDFTISPNTKGIIVQNNKLNDVFRGIYINGITGFETSVRENTVTMLIDNVFNGTQHGIDFSNTMSAGNIPQQFVATENDVSGTGTGSMEAMYFNSLNFGLESPVVSCNKASASYQGFVFSGPNTPTTSIIGTKWFGNSMENLSRGMVLTNTAIIGAQGYSLIGMGNMWLGSTWSFSADLNTYTQNSNASLSPLYCAPQGSLNPSFNDGSPITSSYEVSGFPPYVVSSGGNYSCTDPSARSATFESVYHDLAEDVTSIVNSGLYRFIHYNDSINPNDIDLSNFYSSFSGSILEDFVQIESYLFQGDYSSANSLLSSLTATNNVEANSILFYGLYTKYLQGRADNNFYSSGDSLDLLSLAMLCPEEQGSCIYQARALYEYIYSIVPLYPGCDGGTGARQSIDTIMASEFSSKLNAFHIIPNPNEGSFFIKSEKNISVAQVAIYDCTGRLLTKLNTTFEGSTTKLHLDLTAGIYQLLICEVDVFCNALRIVINKR